MKGYCVYSQIHQLKEKGFRKTTVAKMLGINRRTVNRYWDMLTDDYEINASNICRERALGEYESIMRSFAVPCARIIPSFMAATAIPFPSGHIQTTPKFMWWNETASFSYKRFSETIFVSTGYLPARVCSYRTIIISETAAPVSTVCRMS